MTNEPNHTEQQALRLSIKRLRAKGFTYAEIAERLGITVEQAMEFRRVDLASSLESLLKKALEKP